jgi:uncharacterized protein YbjT (DUF2867 family)
LIQHHAQALIQARSLQRLRRKTTPFVQPIVSDDVAAVLARVAVAAPLNRMVDLAGPDANPLDEVVRQFLKATRDPARSSPTSKPPTSASR